MMWPNHSITYQKVIVYEGHKDTIFSIAFSPYGDSVISGSWDKTIRIWGTHGSSRVGRQINGNAYVCSISHSPVGHIIASGSFDGKIRLWDTNTSRQVGGPLEGHRAKVNSVAFSPGGSLIASGSTDETVRLWNAQSGTLVSRPFVGHKGYVHSVAFSPDGTRIFSGSSDTAIYLWDVERGVSLGGPLMGHTNAVQSVAVSPDGSQIISGSADKTLRLWDTRSGDLIGRPYNGHSCSVVSVAFSPNGTYVASGSNDHSVCIWDVRAGSQVYELFKEHTGSVSSVAFSPCGKHIASGSHDQTVMLWSFSGSHPELKHDFYGFLEDETLEIDRSGDIGRQMSIQEMFNLLSRHGCVNLGSQMDINQDNATPKFGGGFGDIWEGALYDGTKVAIKTWRPYVIEQCDYKILKRAAREIYCWSKMKHVNVHHLMGVIMFKGRSLGMVSEWMENGNLHDYLRKNPSADRFQLSVQVASGLAYIHSYNMVHGDVKALNVLVSSDGVAKLTDFGLSIIFESSLPFSSTTSQAGSMRWMSPEQILEGSSRNKPSDVYALGMTILEIFTGAKPYYLQCPRDFQVLIAVQQGILPARPTNSIKHDEHGNELWGLLVSCWDRDPSSRLSMKQIMESLFSISSSVFRNGEGVQTHALH